VADTRFGALLRAHRLAAGLSQADLAERARLSVETVGALERGVRRAPYRDTVALLARGLDLSEEQARELARAAERARRAKDAGNRETALTPRRLGDALIGRDDDVREIASLLAEHRFVTIAGSGGVGKTRVALEVAARYGADGRRPVTFVDLTPLGDGAYVASNLATLLDLAIEDATPDRIAAALGESESLLLFDNCEHLIDAVAEIVAAVRQRCPNISILTTSRERLSLTSEWTYRLPSLSYPELESRPSDPGAYTSVQLFLERVPTGEPDVLEGETALAAIGDICRRLEGIPLAIELAAARVPVLGLEELRARLNDRFVLATESRSLPARQQTMRATIAWSYDLLSEDEQTVLCRLAAFSGSFRLDAAEYVCADEHLASETIVDILVRLVTKSLVNVVRGDTVRYALLESVRAFAFEQLRSRDAVEAVFRRHLQWFDDLLQRARPLLIAEQIDLMWPELENVRGLLGWAFGPGAEQADLVAAGSLVGRMSSMWTLRGLRGEWMRWADIVLERVDEAEHPLVIETLGPGLVTFARGTSAIPTVEFALRHFERRGDPIRIAWGTMAYASELHQRGFGTEALAAAERALTIARDLSGPDRVRYAATLARYTQYQALHGDVGAARESLRECLSLARQHNDDSETFGVIIIQGIIEFLDGNARLAASITEDSLASEAAKPLSRLFLSIALTNLATYRLALGELDTVDELVDRVLNLRVDSAHKASYDAIQLAAASAALRKLPIPAARLMGFVDAWYEDEGYRRDKFDAFSYDLLNASVREQLSEDELARHVAAGAAMSRAAADREVRAIATRSGSSAPA
jgi:predicted ATPase/DNA-binding XRE family transcriptional regulator